MLKLTEGALPKSKSRNHRASSLTKAHGQAQTERWLREGLAAAGLRKTDLASLRGSDARKVALAELLWRHTTVSQGWIAQRLHMKSAANVSQLLRRDGSTSQHRPRPLPKPFADWLDSVQIC